MDDNARGSRVTKSASAVAAQSGDVDRQGELVGSLVERIGTARDPGRYIEKPGLDERIAGAGANVAGVRRLLGVSR